MCKSHSTLEGKCSRKGWRGDGRSAGGGDAGSVLSLNGSQLALNRRVAATRCLEFFSLPENSRELRRRQPREMSGQETGSQRLSLFQNYNKI